MSEPANAIQLVDSDRLTDRSFEVLRLWVTQGGGSSAWLAPAALRGPRAFGRLLADAMQHGARAFSDDSRSEEAVLDEIVEGFAAAMSHIAPGIITPAEEFRA